ncbi:unnamed protein product [Closterium sp. Naga37s-1]|nr:unnamed protein product [Closterium sp. Naga37s-1]
MFIFGRPQPSHRMILVLIVLGSGAYRAGLRCLSCWAQVLIVLGSGSYRAGLMCSHSHSPLLPSPVLHDTCIFSSPPTSPSALTLVFQPHCRFSSSCFMQPRSTVAPHNPCCAAPCALSFSPHTGNPFSHAIQVSPPLLPPHSLMLALLLRTPYLLHLPPPCMLPPPAPLPSTYAPPFPRPLRGPHGGDAVCGGRPGPHTYVFTLPAPSTITPFRPAPLPFLRPLRRPHGGDAVSGGHTAEMLCLVGALDHGRYSPRCYIAAATDAISLPKARQLEQALAQEAPAPALPVPPPSYLSVYRSREVGQSYLTSVLTTIAATLHAMLLVARVRPQLLLCNGPGTCLPICIAVFTLHVLGVQSSSIVFVESVARVDHLSLTGRLLHRLGIVDRFFVQWPHLTSSCKGTHYLLPRAPLPCALLPRAPLPRAPLPHALLLRASLPRALLPRALLPCAPRCPAHRCPASCCPAPAALRAAAPRPAAPCAAAPRAAAPCVAAPRPAAPRAAAPRAPLPCAAAARALLPPVRRTAAAAALAPLPPARRPNPTLALTKVYTT